MAKRMTGVPAGEEQAFTPKNPGFAARCRDSFGRQPFMDTLGIRMAVIEPGYCELHVDNRPALTQQHGFVHGGVLATLADCAAGYAAFSLMPADSSPLTVEYKLNILRPGQGETMVARARVIKPGRTLTVVDSDVYGVTGGAETLCVTSIQTLMTLHGRVDGPSA